MSPGTQQTPPAATHVNPAINAATKNFTHAESAQRSMALGVDKKLQRINQERSESGRSSLRQLLGTESASIADDRSFSSITDITQLPASVITILEAHGLGFSQGDKIIHQPGASYFSLATMESGEKKYHTFSLDEPTASQPEPATEPDSPNAPVVVESPTSSTQEPQSIEVAEPVQGISSTPFVVEQVPASVVAGTLGTVGVAVQSPPNLGGVPEGGGGTDLQYTTVPPLKLHEQTGAISSPPNLGGDKPQLTPESIKESIKLELKSIEVPKVDAPLERAQKILTTARNASGREREAYMANTYRDRADGTFSALFGNNDQVRNKLFVTIAGYESAKKEYLSEMKKQSPSFSSMLAWERDEQSRLSELLPHAKFGTYRKITNMFHLAPPAKLETRNLIIASAPTASRVAMAQQLGIHDMTKQEPAWTKLFAPLQEKQMPVSRMGVVQSPSNLGGVPEALRGGGGTVAENNTPASDRPDSAESPTGSAEQEGKNTETITRKPDYKKIFTKLHDLMRIEWKLNRPVLSEHSKSSTTTPTILDTVPEVVSVEKPVELLASIITEPVPTVSIEPMAPVVPEPLQFGAKQHPESLFA